METAPKRIQTPRGNFLVEEIFETEEAARASGYERYFGYIDETRNVYVHVYVLHPDLENICYTLFGFVLEKR